MLLFRAPSVRAEAAFIAETVREWLDAGTAPQNVAILFRSIRNVEPYEGALLDRDVPVVTGGDANVFSDRRALDALALLWNVYDPFRHDWLLRTSGNPAFGLSDASLVTLCGEPPNPQTPLFVLDDERAPTVRSTRWDPKRDCGSAGIWCAASATPIFRRRLERASSVFARFASSGFAPCTSGRSRTSRASFGATRSRAKVRPARRASARSSSCCSGY